MSASNPQTDVNNAIVDEILPGLAATLYRVAANLAVVDQGNVPSLFEIERKGSALAQALAGLLSYASATHFYTLQNARYAEDYFAAQGDVQKSAALASEQVDEPIDLSGIEAEIAALLDLDDDGEVSPPIVKPKLPKRRTCAREDCNRTFKPKTQIHVYCTDTCKSVVNTRKKRAAEKAAKAMKKAS